MPKNFFITHQNTQQNLLEDLSNWFHVGPYKTLIEYELELTNYAKNIAPKSTTCLVEALLYLDKIQDERVEILEWMIEKYAQWHSESLAEVAIKYLTPQGPPILLDLLGTTKQTMCVTILYDTISIPQAKDQLLVSYIDALAEIGGAKAWVILMELDNQPNLSETVKQELAIVLHNK